MPAREGPEELGEEQRAGERAAKNTAVRAAGELAGRVASLVLFAGVARSLGEDGLGAFVLALAFLEITTTPIELGLSRYLTRQVAKDKSVADELFFNVIALKVTAAVPMSVITVVAVNLLPYDGQTRETVYVLLAGLVINQVTKAVFAVFNAHERGDLVAVTLVTQRVAAAGLGLAALAAGGGVVAVAFGYSLGVALSSVQAGLLLRSRIGLPRRNVARSSWLGITKRSMPFAVSDVFNVLLFKIDTVILSLIAVQAAVGRYGAAYRLIDSTMFLTVAVAGAFIAQYAYLNSESQPTLQTAFERSIKFALIALVPAAVTLAVLAEPVCRLFFGAELEDAAGPLRLLAPVVVALGVVTLCTSMVVSQRSAGPILRATGAMVVLNVVLNVILIPIFDEEGAALAMLATEAVFVVIAIRLAQQTMGGHLRWTPMVGAPLVAGAAMAVAMLLLAGSFPVAAVVGIVLYGVVFAVVERRLAPRDYAFGRDMLRRRLPARLAG